MKRNLGVASKERREPTGIGMAVFSLVGALVGIIALFYWVFCH